MRHKIYEIFKALRHFGVSATEIDGIAKAYKFWLKHPQECVNRSYRVVYYHEGVLYSLPFLVDELKDRFVGIEINKVVYYAFQKRSGKSDISSDLSMMRANIFNFTLETGDWDQTSDINIELPSRQEIISMFNTINGNGMDKLHDGKNLCDAVPHIYSTWWVVTKSATSTDSQEKMISVEAVRANGICCNDWYSVMQPVSHLRRGVDFIGHINHFGVPDEKTAKVYEKLLLAVKH